MLELLTYLRANGFKTFIVSGGGIDFMRPWIERIYGIPPEQVVGSSGVTKFDLAGPRKPELMKVAKIEFIDDRPGKPVGIDRFIGRRPILAFGNSDGDQQMLEWTAAGSGRASWASCTTPTRSAMGLRPQLADRQARQGLDEADAAELDGGRHEAGLEGDLPIRATGAMKGLATAGSGPAWWIWCLASSNTKA